MPNPVGGRSLSYTPPVTTLEPLPNNRCPRCEGKLYKTWYQELSCYTCGYEVPVPPPPVPTPAELQALPGAMPFEKVRALASNRIARDRISIDAKRILELRAQGMKNDEIAAALSMSTSKLTDTLRRAREYAEKFGVDTLEHAL